MHRDLDGVVNRVEPLTSFIELGPQLGADTLAIWRAHGRAVTSLIAAKAGNGAGVTGMLWSADVTVYTSTNSSGRRRRRVFDSLKQLRDDLRANPVSLLNISMTLGSASGIRARDGVALDSLFKGMLDDTPELAIVMSAGNDSITYSPAALPPSAPGYQASAVRLQAAFPALGLRPREGWE
jgi:hypothetical protein